MVYPEYGTRESHTHVELVDGVPKGFTVLVDCLSMLLPVDKSLK